MLCAADKSLYSDTSLGAISKEANKCVRKELKGESQLDRIYLRAYKLDGLFSSSKDNAERYVKIINSIYTPARYW